MNETKNLKKLTAEEFEIMKTHTLIGATMLKHMTVYQNEAIVSKE